MFRRAGTGPSIIQPTAVARAAKGLLEYGVIGLCPNVTFLKVHAKGEDVWVVGTGTILHTSDGGATWTNHIPNEYKDVDLQGVFVLDHDTVWVTGGSDIAGHAVILKTTNAGLTWTRQGEGNVDVDGANHLLGISAADANTAWTVGGIYSVLKTTDGGTTWTRDPNPSFINGANVDVNEVYAVSTRWSGWPQTT